MVLSVETLDFFPIGFPSRPTQVGLAAYKSDDCGSASSTFLAFWMGEGQVLCLDLDTGRERRSPSPASDLLEKTKYSLVANSSNYGSSISELVSSSNKLAVRFFAKQGNFPGRGFRAKFKIGTQPTTQCSFIVFKKSKYLKFECRPFSSETQNTPLFLGQAIYYLSSFSPCAQWVEVFLKGDFKENLPL